MTTGRKVRLLRILFVGSVAVSTLPAVAVGGDFMGSRLLLPLLWAMATPVLFLGIADWSTDDASTTPATTWRTATAGIVGCCGAVAMLALLVVMPTPPESKLPRHTNATQQFGAYLYPFDLDPNSPLVFMSGRPLAPSFDHRQIRIANGIGAAGATAEPQVFVFDRLSLVNPVSSHFSRLTGYSLPGHHKWVPTAWVVAMTTAPSADEATLAERTFDRLTIPTMPYHEMPTDAATDLAAARRALRCPAIADLLAAAREPLTLSRAWRNFTGAFRRTRVSIDPNPHVAARCR